MTSRTELRDFVAGLRIPASRKAAVEVELLDHLESRIAAEVAAGEATADAEQIAFAALGDLEALRASLERIEPAFELDPARTIARGLGSALATSLLFAIVGALIPHGPGVGPKIAAAVPSALVGLVVMWLLAPRGIGAAMVAEVRATVASGQATTRRRAVRGYVWSVIAVFHAIWAASFLGLPDAIRNDILMPWGLLGLGFGPYALVVFRRARSDVRARHAG